MIPRKVFWLIDALVLVGAFQAAYVLTPVMGPLRDLIADVAGRYAGGPQLQPDVGQLPPISQLVWVLFVIAPAVLLALEAIGAYGRVQQMSRIRVLLSGPLAVTVGLSLAASVIFALRIQEWSRLFLSLFGLVAGVAITGVRIGIRMYHTQQAKAGYYTKQLLVVGANDSLAPLVRRITANRQSEECHFVGYLEAEQAIPFTQTLSAALGGQPTMRPRPGDKTASGAATTTTAIVLENVGRPGQGHQAQGVNTLARLGTVDDLDAVLQRHQVDGVVAVLPIDGGGWVKPMLDSCDNVGVPIRMVPEILLTHETVNLRVAGPVAGSTLPAIGLAQRDLSAEALQLKRLIDVVGSALLLLCLSPLFLLLALLVRLSGRGPILYRWRVIGQNGKEFLGYKFRTMTPDADASKAQLLAHNEMQGPVFKMKKDPRVTRIGRWLRKYSLDELPQLYSVLKGDMSLVGPRPAGVTERRGYEFWHIRKLSIRPGITCLWQVRGRNQVFSFDEWVRMDLEYIDNWSLWLDLKILALTAIAVLKGTGH